MQISKEKVLDFSSKKEMGLLEEFGRTKIMNG